MVFSIKVNAISPENAPVHAELVRVVVTSSDAWPNLSKSKKINFQINSIDFCISNLILTLKYVFFFYYWIMGFETVLSHVSCWLPRPASQRWESFSVRSAMPVVWSEPLWPTVSRLPCPPGFEWNECCWTQHWQIIKSCCIIIVLYNQLQF